MNTFLNIETCDSKTSIPPDFYKSMAKFSHLCPDLMKLFKLSLLIPPSTVNVERGFSVLTMLHTKYCNSLHLVHWTS